MELIDLQKKLIEYQKAKDTLRLSVLRYLLSALKNKEIELRVEGVPLNQEHIEKVINKQMKQRKDSIESYEKGGRADLVEKESSELTVLEELLEYVQNS